MVKVVQEQRKHSAISCRAFSLVIVLPISRASRSCCCATYGMMDFKKGWNLPEFWRALLCLFCSSFQKNVVHILLLRQSLMFYTKIEFLIKQIFEEMS